MNPSLFTKKKEIGEELMILYHVFFGLNLINGVLPKKKPNTYAMISFTTTKLAGNTNQINPRKTSQFSDGLDFTFKYIVDNKMRLNNHQQQRHVSPSELGKLKFVMTLFQIHYE